MEQCGVQQLHHVQDLIVQLGHVALGQHICQHGQEVISTIQTTCEADGARR